MIPPTQIGLSDAYFEGKTSSGMSRLFSGLLNSAASWKPLVSCCDEKVG